MWQFLLVVGSAGTHPLPPVSYAIPLWAYALFLQAALAAAALAAAWWLGLVEKELNSTTREIWRLADEVRSRSVK